ncbi:hypothetical protein SADO_11304 [Salinisphaera dokdonensis CL-ES53]|uniref:Uncharacterized protein n=1 Tax=Salinisphaera dokdonensis CL-ES53 TaxID=1304272 RepID=A0ABV2B1S0_9GAMM
MRRRGGLAVIAALALMLSGGALLAEEQGGTDAGAPAGTAKSSPRDYLKFSNSLTSDCMLHRARLRSVVNTHPDRAIRVVLVSYTGKTRSQGSSDLLLAPQGEPQPLGCNGTSGLERRWEITSARFVSADD